MYWLNGDKGYLHETRIFQKKIVVRPNFVSSSKKWSTSILCRPTTKIRVSCKHPINLCQRFDWLESFLGKNLVI
jgi:hypothetical protein